MYPYPIQNYSISILNSHLKTNSGKIHQITVESFEIG